MERSLFHILLVVALLLVPKIAIGHPAPTSKILVERTAERLTLHLEFPASAFDAVVGDAAAFGDYLAAHLQVTDEAGVRLPLRVAGPLNRDGEVVRVSVAAASSKASRLHLHDDAILETIHSHKTFVSLPAASPEGAAEPLGVLQFQQEDLELPALREGAPSDETVFADYFRLGRRHIAEGADHLLFLFVLLLTAPSAQQRVWRRVAAVVTAFSIGHAITLAATVTGALVLGPRAQNAVEIGIAVSIVFAAVSAARPQKKDLPSLAPPLLGGAFGLLHGLAFAGALRSLQYTPQALAKGLFAFHLGVEVTQLVLVAVTLPWMLKLYAPQAGDPVGEEPYRYFVFRVSSAVLAAIVASGWIAERAFGRQNPFAPLAEGLIAHPILAMVAFAAIMSLSAEGAERLSATPIPREHR